MHTTFPIKIPKPLMLEDLISKIGNCELIYQGKDSNCLLKSISSLHNANNESLVFCSKPKTNNDLKTTSAKTIIVPEIIELASNKILIVTDDPLEWFINALHFLFDLNRKSSNLIEDFDLTNNFKEVIIGKNTVVEEGCKIGENSKIGSNCFIGRNVIIGKNVFIQNNTSIGGEGLGYHISKNGKRLFFPHMGSVILGDDVVIGSNSVIVRGQLQDTAILAGTRIGNLVNIGHNVNISQECIISSNVCVAGGVKIGIKCNIAAGVTINAKKIIGDNCLIGLGSVVTKNLEDGKSVFGNPAKQLPTMRNF